MCKFYATKNFVSKVRIFIWNRKSFRKWFCPEESSQCPQKNELFIITTLLIAVQKVLFEISFQSRCDIFLWKPVLFFKVPKLFMITTNYSTVLHGSQAVYENYYCSPWFPSCLWRLALFFRFPSCSWEPVLFSMVPKLSMKTSTVLQGSQAVYENQYCYPWVPSCLWEPVL